MFKNRDLTAADYKKIGLVILALITFIPLISFFFMFWASAMAVVFFLTAGGDGPWFPGASILMVSIVYGVTFILGLLYWYLFVKWLRRKNETSS